MIQFILSTVNLLGFSSMWQNYLAMETPEKVIIGIVVFALLATLLYFLYRILDGFAAIFKGIFWILKLILFVIVIILFSVAWVFFIIPFGFFRYQKFATVVEIYKNSIRRLKIFFFPKSEKDLIMTREEIAKKVTQQDKKGMNQAKKPSTEKGEKEKGEDEPSKFHCSNCGAAMPKSMVSLLKKSDSAFCEACGQKFKMEGGVPYPVE
ncbi:MAG: hypothetical protein DRO88_12345 [Promethearchaeia archaeon]|nr:MAG: hypothetical protein DRO88_12345 [Candidatus Lokiarchaeia archaeon]